MKSEFTKLNKLAHIETYLSTSVAINDSDKSEGVADEGMDFDLDFDPNEMYYDLLIED